MAILNNDNLISNLSYTEKDFQVIYPALLDLVKKLTARWDPSASNESDPGVLLLKLNALIADKCNYNIDKNVLECFPISVTQPQNARQLFEQLGYYMHWYQAAQTIVSLRYIGSPVTESEDSKTTKAYTIPKFTMVCDDQKNLVYTLVDSGSLNTNGAAIALTALQGVAVDLTINGEQLITVANLDSNNRIYFDTTAVAENGIFITNAGATNYTSWKKKDNLLIEEVSDSNFFYKFGVSQDLNTCYIEFPENAEALLQEGIYITYINTDGKDGNAAVRSLSTFYNTVTVEDEDDVVLDSSNVSITNYIVGFGGEDVETIDEAYLGYKKIVGTFDTLITLRDYTNALRLSSYASNGIASDRTTDIQSSYKIISENGSVDQALNELDKNDEPYDVVATFNGSDFVAGEYVYERNENWNYYDTAGKKSYRVITKNGVSSYIQVDPVRRATMNAFDLKTYILSATPVVKTAANFNKTFLLNTDAGVQSAVEAELNEYKCVQHNIVDLLPNKICLIKNKYPITCKVIPQYTLNTTQQNEILQNIEVALYENLNASKIEFGKEIDYETIYNIILEADPRIKTIALDPIKYTPYIVYLYQQDPQSEVVLKEEDFSSYILKLKTGGVDYEIDWSNIINQFRVEIYAKSVLAGRTQFYMQDTLFNYSISQKYQLLRDDIGKIETSLEVDLNSTNDWQYPLKENENIQLLASNLIEYSSYSSNVKFEHCISNTINAGISYMLKENEYIIFYWSDDTVDSGHVYAIYGKGSIIRPNFTITGNTKRPVDLLGKELIANCEEVTVNNQTYLYAHNQTTNATSDSSFDDKVAALKGDNLLSSNKCIYILLKNTINLDNTSYSCYWVLNDKTSDDRYVLFDDTIGTQRILQANEYFIYSSNTSADMTILGAGTYISRIIPEDAGESLPAMSCKAIDYSTIVSEGLTALTDYWVNLSKQSYLSVAEMQYTAFGFGTILKIQPKEMTRATADDTYQYDYEHVKYECKLQNGRSIVAGNPLLLRADEFFITYKWNTEAETYEYRIFSEGSIINVQENITPVTTLVGANITIKNADDTYKYMYKDILYTIRELPHCTYTDSYYLTGYGHIVEIKEGIDVTALEALPELTNSLVVEAYDMPSISEVTIVSDNKQPTNLYYCDIQYKSSINDTFWTSIGELALDDITLSWKGMALLKLNTSSSTAQALYSGQILKCFIYDFAKGWLVTDDMEEKYEPEDWEEVKPIIIDPDDTEHFGNPTYILTSTVIDALGPDISTISYDVNNNIQTIAIYAYLEGEHPGDIYPNEKDGSINVIFRNSLTQTNVKEMTFKLPKGQYILPVEHQSADIDNLKFELLIPSSDPENPTVVVLASMGDSTITNFSTPGNYYLKLSDLPDSTGVEFFLTLRITMHYTKQHSEADPAPAVSILLPPIFKYENSTSLSESQSFNDDIFIKIDSKIKELDYNHRFNYAYTVNTDTEISNPLDPMSFLDPNHIINAYTICQMDVSHVDHKIQVTNVTK